MKEIALTKGQVSIVDDAWFEFFCLYSWHAKPACGGGYYALARINNELVLMHRLVMGLAKKDFSIFVDHINGVKTDNRRSNLRIATKTQNRVNSRKRDCNTSGYIGVHWDKSRGKWQSAINDTKGGSVYIGRFDDPVVAAHQRDRVARSLFGEFAKLNFPDE